MSDTTRKQPRGTLDRIVRLEAAWKAAYRSRQADPSDLADKAEQRAWDAMTEAKDEIGECHMPGCRRIDREYAECSGHRR